MFEAGAGLGVGVGARRGGVTRAQQEPQPELSLQGMDACSQMQLPTGFATTAAARAIRRPAALTRRAERAACRVGAW